MSFTYNPSNTISPGTTDQIRFLIGDTDDTEPLLQDEEIQACLLLEGDTFFAAARAAQSIASTFARKVTKSIGPLHLEQSQKFAQYKEVAQEMLVRGTLGVMPYAGGISVTDKQNQEQDSDRLLPDFSRTTMGRPGIDPVVTDLQTYGPEGDPSRY